MGRIILFILLALILGLGLFFYFAPFKAIDLVLPDLREVSQINAQLKGDSVSADIDFVFKNKSLFKVKIDTLYYKVSLHDTVIVEETVPIMLEQVRGQTDTVKLPINFSLKSFRALLNQLSEDDSTELKMETYIICHTIIGKVKIPFDKTQKIAVPVPPKIRVLEVSQKRYHLRDRNITAIVKIEIINKSKMLDLTLSNIKYKLVVKNNLSSEGTIQQSVKIEPGATKYLDIPVTIEMDRPLKTIIAVARDKDKFPYTLHMTCILRENMMEEGHEIPIDLTSEGMMELKK